MTQSVQSHNFVSDPELVASFFEALIDGFKNRRLSLNFDGKEIVLKPAEIFDMSLETSKRKGRQKLAMTISWPEADAKERRSLLPPKTLEESPASEGKLAGGAPGQGKPSGERVGEKSGEAEREEALRG